MIKWSNMRIGFKYGIALTATIILFVFASSFVITSLFQIGDAVSTIEVTADRSITLTHMASLFRAKELLVADYMSLERKSILDEYEKIQSDFKELQEQIDPKMDTEELKFTYDLISRNNEQMDNTFKNVIIPNMQQNNMDEVSGGHIKISSLRNPTAQLFEKLREIVDGQRKESITDAYQKIENSIRTLIISIVLAAVLGSIIVFLISRGISKNLNRLVDITYRVSKGDLTVDRNHYHGKDEIGQLTSAIYDMVHNLQNMMQEITKAALEVDSESSELRKIADEVKEGSYQIASTMQQMSAGAEDQAHASSEIAHSIFTLAELISQANINKEVLETSSKDILTVVQKGNIQMETSINNMNQINIIIKDSVTKVTQLDENSQKVSTLVQVIDTIAEQTNLLALNAAIEAARAGESGRGFAVVAEEIRKLAEQVGKSSKEITAIVEGIQSESKFMMESLEKGYQEIEMGTHQIRTTGEAFQTIDHEVITMIEKIKDVSESLSQISQNSDKISVAGEQVAAISEENSAGIEQTVASVQQQSSSMEVIAQNTHSLSMAADKLNNVVNQFKL
ncbi:methyl-accepting chemotaxis protein [Geosporobacter ferrireducens]|uniref:Chemotaxis protein n=1 Tax=Geosporobacter ferrireducens TaxID=1424294 RepID=A0A1D8GQH0_9FIRM|nr:HAMP domain-containing methyl-accepting chemotaxis protein [Geosporobacter ferrireducens]AOT73118.1 hypothetical protein Gferi_13540 [Geosporobacter ferrireducens]